MKYFIAIEGNSFVEEYELSKDDFYYMLELLEDNIERYKKFAILKSVEKCPTILEHIDLYSDCSYKIGVYYE